MFESYKKLIFTGAMYFESTQAPVFPDLPSDHKDLIDLDEMYDGFDDDGHIDSKELTRLKTQFELFDKEKLNLHTQTQQILSDFLTDMENTLHPKSEELDRQLGNNEYIVETGDTLWDIVKKHYKLSDNAEIISKINEVIDAQTAGVIADRLQKDIKPNNAPDGIRGDQLWAGDVIYLPPVLEKT